jgi:hypothetical protein
VTLFANAMSRLGDIYVCEVRRMRSSSGFARSNT